MKLNIRNAVWAFALAIAVTVLVMPNFAVAQQNSATQGIAEEHQATTHPQSIATSGILLFNGIGTSGDVQALEYVITNNMHMDYDTVNSAGLDGMTVAQLAAYKLLIIPGGDSITIGKNISTNTTAHIKTAVRTNGLHYLGVCAGAFLASYAGGTTYNDIDLLNGIWFDMYPETAEPAAELLSRPQGQLSIDVYWEDGPSMATQGGSWGTIVAKYPNYGQPAAIIQGFAGNGWTLLQGVHPEAPQSWRNCCVFTTSLADDLAYSATLISAALNGTVLPHY
ncbi:MAG TPA: BPL-N domain-containing protein [Candidatus Acidoferrum sp.]|nr:BPL-N domain-containing protein [Candidatus Acidoferrum sp.]